MQPLTALEAGAFNAGMAGVLMGWPDLLPSTEQNSAQTLSYQVIVWPDRYTRVLQFVPYQQALHVQCDLSSIVSFSKPLQDGQKLYLNAEGSSGL